MYRWSVCQQWFVLCGTVLRLAKERKRRAGSWQKSWTSAFGCCRGNTVFYREPASWAPARTHLEVGVCGMGKAEVYQRERSQMKAREAIQTCIMGKESQAVLSYRTKQKSWMVLECCKKLTLTFSPNIILKKKKMHTFTQTQHKSIKVVSQNLTMLFFFFLKNRRLCVQRNVRECIVTPSKSISDLLFIYVSDVGAYPSLSSQLPARQLKQVRLHYIGSNHTKQNGYV